MKVRVATSVLILACAASSAAGAACATDAQCASHFCDAGRCALPRGDYGRACTGAPRDADGLRDGKLNVCGAYVCIDARCRSCASDAQCRDEYGAPACVVADGRPGRRCGRP